MRFDRIATKSESMSLIIIFKALKYPKYNYLYPKILPLGFVEWHVKESNWKLKGLICFLGKYIKPVNLSSSYDFSKVTYVPYTTSSLTKTDKKPWKVCTEIKTFNEGLLELCNGKRNSLWRCLGLPYTFDRTLSATAALLGSEHEYRRKRCQRIISGGSF